MRVENRSGSRERAAAVAPCVSVWSLSHHRVANVGGAMSIWAVLTRVIAVAGVLALALRDYSREIKPLSLSSIPAGAARRTNLRLAA